MALSDTAPEMQAKRDALLRAMSGEERLRIARELTLGVQRLAFAGLRQRYPDLSDDELWLKLAARRLGVDVVRKVYGREIDPT
jgi:predicted alpha-1,6-mannanase (GH76 family)